MERADQSLATSATEILGKSAGGVDHAEPAVVLCAAVAAAASAAVPGLIGPLIVRSRRHKWSEFRDGDWQDISPAYKRLHLWDGGVYDNLGVEALFKPGTGLREDTDFLIVCDASWPLGMNHDDRGGAPVF